MAARLCGMHNVTHIIPIVPSPAPDSAGGGYLDDEALASILDHDVVTGAAVERVGARAAE
jgi:hypothetical protein